MADLFTKEDAWKVLQGRTVWFVGDSNMRAVYKDLVWLLHNNSLISMSALKSKLEYSFMNDHLVKGKSLHKGRNYTELIPTRIDFVFITECLSEELRFRVSNVLPPYAPDVVVMNSCLWDITRWGPDGVQRYKRNMRALMNLFKNHFPQRTLVIWTTTPPLSNEPYGGFLIKQIDFLKQDLRFEVMEANMFVRDEVVRHGFDLLDIHYHLMLQIHRRRPDGIHWNPDAMRHITNLILTHIALSFKMNLPGNFKSVILDQAIKMYEVKENKEESVVKKLQSLAVCAPTKILTGKKSATKKESAWEKEVKK